MIRDIFSWNLNSKYQYIKEYILVKKPDPLEKTKPLVKHMEATRAQAKTLEESFVGGLSLKPKYSHSQSVKSISQHSKTPSRTRQTQEVSQQESVQAQQRCSKCLQVHRYRCPAKGVKYTGADTNILTLNTFNKLGISSDVITKRKKKEENIPTTGQCNLKVFHNNHSYTVIFHIGDINSQNIMGRNSCKTLNILKRTYNVNILPHNACENIMSLLNDVFEELGCLKNFECNSKFKADAMPSLDACRRIPFQLQDTLKKELQDLEKNTVIYCVEKLTEWVSSLVLTANKNGRLRLCIDPRKLNKAILRPHYQFATLNEIKSDLAGAKFFTTP